MKVILNCHYGDKAPGEHDLDAKIAKKLIDAGHAVAVGTDGGKKEDTPKGEAALKAKLASADDQIKTLTGELNSANATIKVLTTERDNALTELALAKGGADGANSTPNK